MGRKKLDPSLNTDLGLQIGQIDGMLGELYEAPGAPGADFSDLTIATADASDPATTQALVNELKASFNALIARLSGE